MNEKCRHLDWDNKEDCENDAEFICVCCSEPVCWGHKDRECPYGGMGYIEIDLANPTESEEV